MLAAVVAIVAATSCSTDSEGTVPRSTTPSGTSTGRASSDSASPNPEPSPQGQTMIGAQTQADREAIIANFRARQQAMIDADTGQLRALSTPDSRAEHITGYDQPRDEWFDQIESGYFDYHSIDNHSIEVTLTGPSTATLVSRSTIDVTIRGSRNSWRLETTAEYIKQDGRWLSGNGSSRTY
ncbi:MAG: DUF4440 domain-containing protein [Propionibacteriaceae bacterium]|nr:DUF4440 domain-containing protein [Propionibacteriaceae bacterium]